jgi:hypothetical protein
MQLYVTAIRHRLGSWRRDAHGASEMQAAEQAACALGIRNPERWFSMLLPGLT